MNELELEFINLIVNSVCLISSFLSLVVLWVVFTYKLRYFLSFSMYVTVSVLSVLLHCIHVVREGVNSSAIML